MWLIKKKAYIHSMGEKDQKNYKQQNKLLSVGNEQEGGKRWVRDCYLSL